MPQVLCPVLVGRELERTALRRVIDGATHGRGGTAVVSGEAGIGKSRLVRDAAATARESGLAVLNGRCVAGPAPSAYRPLSEALLGGLRATEPPIADELGHRSDVMARMLPGWGGAPIAVAEDSPVLVGDAVLGLLRTLGGAGGCVLVLEDLHWADPETLAVVDYLADNVVSAPVAMIITSRLDVGGAGVEMIDRLCARRAAVVVDLARLTSEEVSTMVVACAGERAPIAELEALVDSYGEGIPFMVEELVASWAGRAPADAGAVPVPRTLAASVRQRLGLLTTDERRVIEAAAVLGRDIEWRLLSTATGLDDDMVAAGLQQGIAVQLLVAEGNDLRFRHALSREAVLTTLLPPSRAALAGACLDALEATHPGLPGVTSESAVRLAEEAGLADRAAELLLHAGRRALDQAALASAEAALRSAHAIAPGSTRGDEVDDALVETLALAGKYDEAAAVGSSLLRRLASAGTNSDRRLAVHLRLARAAVAGQRWAGATEHLDAARALATDVDGRRSLARIDALSAHLAIGEGRLEDARSLAERSVDQALADGAVDVACEALEVVGRCARRHDLDQAEQAFSRALRLADEHGLGVWSLRALHELGTIDLFRSGRLDRLHDARRLAVDAGALVTAAMIDLQLTAGYNMTFEHDRSLASSRRCQEACARFRLDIPRALALQMAATCHAVRCDWPAMRTAVDEARALAGHVPEVDAALWGDTLAVASLIREDRPQARERLERAAEIRRGAAAPGPGPSAGLWALVRAVDEGDADQAIAEVVRSGATVNRMNMGLCQLAEAVTAGKSGRGVDAERLFDEGSVHLIMAPWHRHLARRLVVDAALTDGWGQPAAWLAEAVAYFTFVGHDRLASSSRSLLRRAGGSMPRGGPDVPDHLGRLGITAREAEVLSLLVEGESTNGIASRLYVSPRTVEKHLESLQRKTGHHSRARLVAFITGDHTP